MKIAHFADIHWRGLTRHAEFTRGFEDAFSKLRKLQPDVIFLGGDLFHTKTSGISPEVIDRLVWMLESMAKIAEVHITLGNHDGNLANEDRQDAITPIVNAMANPSIHLYKNSGNYPLSEDVHLAVYSCFDKPGWAIAGMVTGPVVNIAAFHGSVGGTQMDNGWVMPDSKAEVKLSMFSGYNFVLLGDIHKRQFLASRPDRNGVMKPYVAYPGSTIQQNFGEDQKKGFLFWNIRANDDWDVDFIEVENFQPYITTPWKDSIEGTLKALEGAWVIRPGARYRLVSHTPLNPLVERQMAHELKVVRGAEEAVFQSEKSMNYDLITRDGVAIKKTSLRNDKSVFHEFYKQFLDANTKKFILSPEQINEGNVVIDGYLDKLNASEMETTRNVSWSLKSFEFNNLFRYGENNKVDFEGLDGIVGVFGKNKIGKSSLIGALMYGLFNGSDREGITKNGQVMNQNKKLCDAKVVVSINGTDYVIERSSSRVEAPKKGKKAQEPSDGAKTETKLEFYKVQPDGSKESLNGTSRDETDKAIRKLLGNSQDFLMTSVASQSKMERFIDEGATSRKAILNRFLDLDIFEKLFGYAKEDVAALNIKMQAFPMGWEKLVLDLQKGLEDKAAEALTIDQKILEAREALDAARLWIAQNESASAVDASINLAKVQQKVVSLKRQQAKAEQDCLDIQRTIGSLMDELARLEKEAESINPQELQANLDKMKVIEKTLQDTTYALKDSERVLQGQEKNVRKLALVPCGDQYPTCLYIKDSHDDKRVIESKKAEVAAISSALSEISQQLKEIQEQKLSEKMKRHSLVEQSIKEHIKEVQEKRTQLSLVEKSKKDIVNWLNLAIQEESKLGEFAASQEDVASLDKKKMELKALQSAVFSEERRKNDILIQTGRDTAALEKLLKDQAECQVLSSRLRVLESVQAAFHKNGIPAIILKTQLPAINAELAKLLGGLVDFDIVFETETGSNVMDIYIEDGHSKRILELGSGMEKMIASIAIRVALINLSSLPKSNVFVIDEGFNALDEEHVGKCMELLQILKGYFKTVLVISHMQRVKESADTIIEVFSNGEDSRIEA
jgi:DNA repair exonuclease SbcCD ATPase subunit/DNA repair exonuclease SbcCD nuclease subunit